MVEQQAVRQCARAATAAHRRGWRQAKSWWVEVDAATKEEARGKALDTVSHDRWIPLVHVLDIKVAGKPTILKFPKKTR